MIILCALGLCLQSAATYAQNAMKTVSNTASTGGFDVNSLTKSITAKMTSTLGLSAAQQTSTTNAVSDFLLKKSSIVGMDKSNPSAYNAKFPAIFETLKSNLGTALTAAQMSKFLGMKPKTNDAKNVMSNLFY